MPNIREIDHLNSEELKIYTQLTLSRPRSQVGGERGLFIAESPKVIGYALDAGYEPVSLLMERRHIEGKAEEIIRRCGDIPVFTADAEVLTALTGYELSRGVLCALRRREQPGFAELCAHSHRITVLENITDPTNVGAIFRSAAALGMDALLLTPSCCDALSRRSVRVSMGTVFQLPWARIGSDALSWPDWGMAELRRLGFRTASMALSRNAVAIDDPRLAAEDKLALILGTEGDGLSANTIARSDYTVMIPMARGVDSLNVAAAGALAFWQLRKR